MREEQHAKQRPCIVAVDHDTATRALLADELDARYGRHYDIVVTGASDDARAFLSDPGAGDVALVVAERDYHGAQVLAATRTLHPHAKRALLIGFNENRSAREEIIQFLEGGDAEYYLAETDGIIRRALPPRAHGVPRRLVAPTWSTIRRDPRDRRRSFGPRTRDLRSAAPARLPLRAPPGRLRLRPSCARGCGSTNDVGTRRDRRRLRAVHRSH